MIFLPMSNLKKYFNRVLTIDLFNYISYIIFILSRCSVVVITQPLHG